MALDVEIVGLVASLSGLEEQRRAQWRDASGQDFDLRFLRPLTVIVQEYHRLIVEFADQVDAAIADLGD